MKGVAGSFPPMAGCGHLQAWATQAFLLPRVHRGPRRRPSPGLPGCQPAGSRAQPGSRGSGPAAASTSLWCPCGRPVGREQGSRRSRRRRARLHAQRLDTEPAVGRQPRSGQQRPAEVSLEPPKEQPFEPEQTRAPEPPANLGYVWGLAVLSLSYLHHSTTGCAAALHRSGRSATSLGQVARGCWLGSVRRQAVAG